MKNLLNIYASLFALLIFGLPNSAAQIPISPLDFNPAVWLDGVDASTFITEDDFVITWEDKSGNNMHANATTVVQRPLYVPAIEGIQFDGLTDILISGDIGHGSDSTITVFVVAKLDVGQEESKSSVLVKGEGGSVPYEIFYRNSKEEIQMNTNSLRGKSIYEQHILGFSYEDEYTTTFYNGEWVSPAYFEFEEEEEPLTIGAKFDDLDIEEYFKGSVYEVIVYQNALTSCEVDQILGYLAHKWDLTDELDSTQPFKTAEFGLCRNPQFFISEDSPAGTTVGTLQGYHLQGDQTITFDNWRIEDSGIAGSFFELDSGTGTITVSNSADLDYEQISSYYLYLSAIADGTRIYGGVTINLQDVADGDSPKEHSELWGVNGEKWDNRGRLPDWSYAGYHSGEATDYSYPSTTVNVLDYGAVPNDAIDDSGAVQDAIDAVSSGIIYFPPGTYYIDNVVQINKSNIVLRGAGQGNTTLYFQNSASDILPPSSSFGNGSDGFFINFEGSFSKDDRQVITEETRRGDKSVTVADASPYTVGQVVRIFYSGNSSDTPDINPVNGGLWNHMHNDQNIEVCEGGYPTGSTVLFLFHTIEKIDGNIITLREPLRLDLRLDWGPYIETPTGLITECGIEDIEFEHEYIVQPEHLDEPGYNSVHFKLSYNCWANNITTKNADNGITMNRSYNNEAKNITLTGRAGHHGISVVASSDCLIDNVSFLNDEGLWHHAITLQGKAKGIVMSNLEGNHELELDFHRDASFDCLITNVTSAWNFESGGGACNGAHSAARSTFWNLFGQATYPEWDHIQTNIISDLAIPEQYHTERGWREKIASVQPANIHLAQFDYRMNYVPDLIFDPANSSSFGSRANWEERDPSRWIVQEENGEWGYTLSFHDIPPLSGNRPGEYSTYNESFLTDMQITADLYTMENTALNGAAEVILLGNFQDDNNYVYVQISSDASESGFYLVENGVSSLLKSINLSLNTNGILTKYTFEIEAGTLRLHENDLLIDFTNNNTFTGGKMGIGSYDDAVFYDNISVTEVYNPLPVEWFGFSVNPVENRHAMLKWSTSSEINNDYFEVERSANGKEWSFVSKVKAARNSELVNHYHFLDKAALKGLSYYRIRQVDLDGTISYSNIKSVFLGDIPTISLQPNPAKDELYIVLPDVQVNDAFLQVFNMSGVSVLQIDGYDLQEPVPLMGLPTGLYLCQLIVNNDSIYKKKFLKQ